MNAALCHDICGCLLPLFPEGFLEHDFLGLVQILGSAALYPAGTLAAIFTLVPGGGHKLPVLHFGCLPSQVQLPALCAGEAVCFWVIFHIFNSSHLFAKLARFLLVVVGGLYEAHLAILLQIQIVLQTFIARVCHHFLIARLVPPGQRIQHGTQCFHICTVREYLQTSNIFAVYRNLDIISRLELAVSHVVFLHSHKGGVCVSLGIAVAPFPHGGQHFLIVFPPFQQGVLRFPVPLCLAFAAAFSADKLHFSGFLFQQRAHCGGCGQSSQGFHFSLYLG